MNSKFDKLLKNISVAFTSQVIALMVSFALSFLTPKVLGVTEFGYWQLFIFYATYVSLFQFGLNDGVYLLNGGKSRDEVDKNSIGGMWKVDIICQLIFTLLFVVFSVFFVEDDSRSIVIISTGIYVFLYNLSYYFGFVFQSIDETKTYSISVIIDRLTFFIPLIILIVMGVSSFEPYIVAFLGSRVCALVYCSVKAKDFIASDFPGFHIVFKDMAKTMNVGIRLMLANMASMLVLGIYRAIVDAGWGIDIFGQFSLALSLVNFFLMFVSQVSMVLFPSLRKLGTSRLKNYCVISGTLLSMIMPIAYMFYYPIAGILQIWLPNYHTTFHYLVLLLPVCVFDSRMNLIGANLLKVSRRESTLLLINVLTLCISLVGAVIGGWVLHDISVLCACAATSIVLRSLFAEIILSKQYGSSGRLLLISEILVSIFFVLINLFALKYAFIFVAVVLIVYYCINYKAFRKGIRLTMAAIRKP